jgi:hypothetical protein
MPDDYRLRGYPRDRRLDTQTSQLRKLVSELRTEAQAQPADGLFSEGIAVTKIQVALRIVEILEMPDPPEPARGKPR